MVFSLPKVPYWQILVFRQHACPLNGQVHPGLFQAQFFFVCQGVAAHAARSFAVACPKNREKPCQKKASGEICGFQVKDLNTDALCIGVSIRLFNRDPNCSHIGVLK